MKLSDFFCHYSCSLAAITTFCDNDAPALILFGSSGTEAIPTNEMHNLCLANLDFPLLNHRIGSERVQDPH